MPVQKITIDPGSSRGRWPMLPRDIWYQMQQTKSGLFNCPHATDAAAIVINGWHRPNVWVAYICTSTEPGQYFSFFTEPAPVRYRPNRSSPASRHVVPYDSSSELHWWIRPWNKWHIIYKLCTVYDIIGSHWQPYWQPIFHHIQVSILIIDWNFWLCTVMRKVLVLRRWVLSKNLWSFWDHWLAKLTKGFDVARRGWYSTVNQIL